MYCEKPLNPREVVIVQAEGSGHYDVGFVQKDPKSFSAISGKKASFTQMCVARMHKKTCNIVLKMNTDGTEVSHNRILKLRGKCDSETKVRSMSLV